MPTCPHSCTFVRRPHARDASRFSRWFSRLVGDSPSRVRSRQRRRQQAAQRPRLPAAGAHDRLSSPDPTQRRILHGAGRHDRLSDRRRRRRGRRQPVSATPRSCCLDGLNERSKNRADRPADQHPSSRRSHARQHRLQGVAKKVVAHAQAAEHMKTPPGRGAGADGAALSRPRRSPTSGGSRSATSGFARSTTARAHTSGDAVITFERANVAHMGDLMFNRPSARSSTARRRVASRTGSRVLEKAAARSRQRHDLHLRPRRHEPAGDRQPRRPDGVARLPHGAADVRAGRNQVRQDEGSDHRDPNAACRASTHTAISDNKRSRPRSTSCQENSSPKSFHHEGHEGFWRDPIATIRSTPSALES